MRQFHLTYKQQDLLCNELENIKLELKSIRVKEILVQIFTTVQEYEELQPLLMCVEDILPEAVYYGCQTAGNVIKGKMTEDATGLTVTVLEDADSFARLLFIETSQGQKADWEFEELVSYCNENQSVKAIEIITSVAAAYHFRFGNQEIPFREDLHIFGGVSLMRGVDVNTKRFVFAKGHAASVTAMVGIIYGGSRLHIDTTYVLGWKGLGKIYNITDCDGDTIKMVNHEPAFDEIYKKNLNIEYNENFVKSVMEFPLLITQNGMVSLRVPRSVGEDGSVTLFLDVNNSQRAQLAYGDPDTILRDDLKCLHQIAPYEPEAIKVFSCLTRRILLGDEISNKETSAFEQIAPVSGFYTGGELFFQNGFLHQLNCTMVISMFREGDKKGREIQIDDTLAKTIKESSLVSRLVNFVRVVNAEMESHYSMTLTALEKIYNALIILNLQEDSIEALNCPQEIKCGSESITSAKEWLHDFVDRLVVSEQVERMNTFVNPSTLDERLKNKIFISEEFINKREGWSRVQLLPVSYDKDGKIEKLIFTSQIIEEEKNREEKLIEEATRDKLTGLYNRRGYEDDIKNLCMDKDRFVILEFDVNGLKVVNDTIGHIAGDELIIGAANCIMQCFGNYGKLYRTGGDEFVALIHVGDEKLRALLREFEELTLGFRGKLVNELSVSVGAAAAREFKFMTFDELFTLADTRMYKAKDESYQKKGIDRKGQIAAHLAICSSLSVILKVNLTLDSYKVIQAKKNGLFFRQENSDSFSEEIMRIAESGIIHEEDLKYFVAKTDLAYTREYFSNNKNSVNVYYRRKIDKKYKMSILEMIIADDYKADNQSVYLYIKDIDR